MAKLRELKAYDHTESSYCSYWDIVGQWLPLPITPALNL